jgi:RNA polymerase sigma factor (sigma-70 family)
MKLFVRSSKAAKLTEWADDRLLQSWREEGDRKCFDQLYDRYIHLVYGVCRKYMEDTEACRDASMQVFSALLEHPADKPIRSLPNWLYTTARNICISQLRSPSSNLVLEPEETFFEKNADRFMENEALTRLLNKEQPHLLDLLPEAMQQLEAGQRQCLKLFFFDGKSYQAISQETGFTLKQVKSYLQNGKRNLGIILKRQRDEG